MSNKRNRVNKQLFLNEIKFRFRKDFGSLRRPGVVIILHEKYWGVGDLWLRASVITKQILLFHSASGEGGGGLLPYVDYIGMYTLKGYGFLEILVRYRVSKWSFWSVL